MCSLDRRDLPGAKDQGHPAANLRREMVALHDPVGRREARKRASGMLQHVPDFRR